MTQVIKARVKAPRTPKAAAQQTGPIDRVLDADFFKALADPTRLRLLACLAKCGRPCAVGEIAACCAVDLSVVSRHLAQLERGGLVESSKQGRVVSYAVRYTPLATILRAMADAFEQCGSACACRASGGACGCVSGAKGACCG